MSKKTGIAGGVNGWRYHCTCGFETVSIGEAVGHLNRNREHQLRRSEI